MLVVVLPLGGFVDLGIGRKFLIQSVRQRLIHLQLERHLDRGPLIQLAPPGFLRHQFHTDYLLGKLALGGATHARLVLLRQRVDNLFQLAGGDFLVADHDHYLVEISKNAGRRRSLGTRGRRLGH